MAAKSRHDRCVSTVMPVNRPVPAQLTVVCESMAGTGQRLWMGVNHTTVRNLWVSWILTCNAVGMELVSLKCQ
jgi:hypothetical protein